MITNFGANVNRKTVLKGHALQLLKVSNFINFHLKTFTQRREAAKATPVGLRKEKQRKLCGIFASPADVVCVFACAFAFLVPACPG